MKTQIIIALMALLCGNAIAQKTFEINEKVPENTQISLDLDFADDINIESWNKNQVKIVANVKIGNNKHNDHFKFETDQIENTLRIKSDIENMEDLGERQIIVNKNGDTIRVENHLELDITFMVYAPKHADMKVKTINGNINLKGITSDIELKTISGEIDLTWPDSQGTDLELKTITGEMYTDFDLQEKKKKGIHCFLPSKYTGKINNGGKELSLETISGNIYLRKK